MAPRYYDTIILGLGAMGSAAAWQLARKGKRVLGIDRFSPPHTFGSSHGHTRVTRLAIGEGEVYTPLALRSHEIWREMERETGMDLLRVTGGLVISSESGAGRIHVDHFFDNTVSAAKKHDIPHELLDAGQIRSRFPQFRVQDDETGYYEYGAGILRPEKCVEANLKLAAREGARILRNEPVTGFSGSDAGVQVTTGSGSYQAGNLIVTAGSWLPGLLGGRYASLFTVTRQILYWFDAADHAELYDPERCPVYIWELKDDPQGLYGFPAVDGPQGGVKLAGGEYGEGTGPDEAERQVRPEEIRDMYERYVQPYFNGLTRRCLRTVTCLYTVTPDSGFVIDRHPEMPSVILASPCSGHGFKHSAAIGEILAELAAAGESRTDTGPFRLSRFDGQGVSGR